MCTHLMEFPKCTGRTEGDGFSWRSVHFILWMPSSWCSANVSVCKATSGPLVHTENIWYKCSLINQIQTACPTVKSSTVREQGKQIGRKKLILSSQCCLPLRQRGINSVFLLLWSYHSTAVKYLIGNLKRNIFDKFKSSERLKKSSASLSLSLSL